MFLDTANIEEINRIVELGFLEGVTTNPTILLKEETERNLQVSNIIKKNNKITFVQLIGESAEQLWEDYNHLMTINVNQHIGVKVSLNYEGLKFIHELKKKESNRTVLGTAIYSTDQGILGVLVGCDYLAPYINRMANNNIDPFEVITNLRRFIDMKNLDTKIMGASFKNTGQIIKAYNAGANTVTIPTDLMEEMISKQLAEDAIKVFNDHGHKLESLNK